MCNFSLLVHDASSSTLNWSCLRACSTRTSAQTLFWSALDAATVSWSVLTVSMSCCKVKLSPPSCPDGSCRVFLISPSSLITTVDGTWFYRALQWVPNVLADWRGRRLTLGTSCGSVYLVGICSFLWMLERDSVWNRGDRTCWLHYDDQVSTGRIETISN